MNISSVIMRYILTGDCFSIINKAAYFANVIIFIGCSVTLNEDKEDPHVNPASLLRMTVVPWAVSQLKYTVMTASTLILTGTQPLRRCSLIFILRVLRFLRL